MTAMNQNRASGANVAVHCNPRLPDGTAVLPGNCDGDIRSLRLGCSYAPIDRTTRGAGHELLLSADIWKRLAIPYDGIPLQLRSGDKGEAILGPTVAILYAGKPSRTSREFARSFYESQEGNPGLFAVGFDEAIDWEQGVMEGYVLDNARGRLVPARFPIPAAIHLRWAIRREVIDELRKRTGGRVFNWVRNMSKWQFHSLLSQIPDLAEHLPETRLLGSFVALAGMLARHHTVFVKQVYGIQGAGVVRIKLGPSGCDLSYLAKGEMQDRTVPADAGLLPVLREILGQGRLIVQQGLDITGRQGRRLDFRVLVVRDAAGGWRAVHRHAKLAPDDRLAFMNKANGADDADMLEALTKHCGLGPQEATETAGAMTGLALRAAEALAGPMHPLGILGVDLARDATTGRIFLLEANTVPGWGYPDAVEADLARSMVDYVIALANE